MLTTTETLLDKGFSNQILKEWDLIAVFDGSDASRYALVNKALKKGELIRLTRGVYVLGSKYQKEKISQFSIAARMVPGSYISFETALSFHGWIPEKVTVIRNVIVKGRTRSFHTPLGEFEYIKIPINEYEFLSGVHRQELNHQPFFIASPLRALADYAYINKLEKITLDFLVEGLRIEQEYLESLTKNDFEDISRVYTSKRVLSFLNSLRKALDK